MAFRRRLGTRASAAATGAVDTLTSLFGYVKQIVTALITMVALDLTKYTADSGWRTVTKADGAVLTGDDDLFVVSGGPILATIIGTVTTVIGANAANGDLQVDVTDPAATVDLNAAPVAIQDDAVNTLYMCLDSTSVFTPVTAGTVIIDHVAAPLAYFIITPGTVIFRSSAANTGVIAWDITYKKLSPDSAVVAA